MINNQLPEQARSSCKAAELLFVNSETGTLCLARDYILMSVIQLLKYTRAFYSNSSRKLECSIVIKTFRISFFIVLGRDSPCDVCCDCRQLRKKDH